MYRSEEFTILPGAPDSAVGRQGRYFVPVLLMGKNRGSQRVRGLPTEEQLEWSADTDPYQHSGPLNTMGVNCVGPRGRGLLFHKGLCCFGLRLGIHRCRGLLALIYAVLYRERDHPRIGVSVGGPGTSVLWVLRGSCGSYVLGQSKVIHRFSVV